MSSIKILKFRVEKFNFGIEVRFLKEVGKFYDFFKIPTHVPYFEGIFNLRGNILPLINIGKKFNINVDIPLEKEKNFIIVNDTQHTFGIYVNEIKGIKSISEKQVYTDTIDKKVKIIHDNGEIVSLIEVKDIINLADFKFKKNFIFKGIETFEEIKEEKVKEKKTSYTIFKFGNNHFAINAENIKQLLLAKIEKFSFWGFSNLICGELEYEKKIIPVINLPVLAGIKFNFSKNLEDWYICICEFKDKLISFLTFYTTEFIEISEEEILYEENFFDKLNFIQKCFKYGENKVRIIDLKKLIDFLKKGIPNYRNEV